MAEVEALEGKLRQLTQLERKVAHMLIWATFEQPPSSYTDFGCPCR